MRGADPLPSTIPSLNKVEKSELQRVFGCFPDRGGSAYAYSETHSSISWCYLRFLVIVRKALGAAVWLNKLDRFLCESQLLLQ